MERLLQQGSSVVYPDLETILALSSHNALLNTKKKLFANEQTHVPLEGKDASIHKNTSQQSSVSARVANNHLPTIPLSGLAAALEDTNRGEDEDRLLPSGKRKPGRKPSNVEPSNKRTAQNRAAQRAFRERRERYVKDLETRVHQLEALNDGKAKEGLMSADISLNLLRENFELKQKVQNLEVLNESLKSRAFALEFPLLEKAASKILPFLGTNFQAPSAIANPFGDSKANEDLLKAMFPTPPSETTNIFSTSGLSQQNDIFSPSQNIFKPSMLPTAPATTAPAPFDYATLLDLTSPSFNQYSETETPFSLAFDQPFQDQPFTDDWLDLLPKDNLFGSPEVADVGVLPSPSLTPSSAVEQIEKAKSEGSKSNVMVELCDDDKLRDRVIEFVEDESALEELCHLFRTKATCTEVQDLQSKMVDACKRNDKEGFLDLVTTAKEKKRMYMLRLKAGVVTPMAPGGKCF
ncbi:hypothetical protein HK098_003760 [Nowakowskiella sp. JEL0407]|nr:hypothetical protein HK098_003760 [Nowakowskiella sp. JEL0407]